MIHPMMSNLCFNETDKNTGYWQKQSLQPEIDSKNPKLSKSGYLPLNITSPTVNLENLS